MEQTQGKKELHPLHMKIGRMLEGFEGQYGAEVLFDPACRDEDHPGKQHLPLFCSEESSSETRYCCVDAMILQEGKVRCIIEIEEANIKPTQICGKFLTAAISKFYIHKNHPGKRGMTEKVFFIQVVDESRLKEKTKKMNQFRHLEKSICALLPLKGSNITKYEIFYETKDSEFKDMQTSIKKFLQGQS